MFIYNFQWIKEILIVIILLLKGEWRCENTFQLSHIGMSVPITDVQLYSCDCIIQKSVNVATAAYREPLLSMTTSGRMIRKDLILVIMRSNVSCCLTGKGFFVVSLEMYTSVSDKNFNFDQLHL